MREVTWFTWPLPLFWITVGFLALSCLFGTGTTRPGRVFGILSIAAALVAAVVVGGQIGIP